MNSLRNPKVKILSLGTIEYREAWKKQEDLFRSTIDIKLKNRSKPPNQQSLTPNYLLFCQHPHVYTLGKSGSEEHLLLDKEALADRHIDYAVTNRGGDITYHGPGQLVCYPIIDLENFFTDIHMYLRTLEEAVIKTLERFQIKSGRIRGLTGVWVTTQPPRKICAMGVKTSRWVTMHGLALNVNPDLHYFDHIVPCGIDDKGVTSMKLELGQDVDRTKVQNELARSLMQQFRMTPTLGHLDKV